MNNSACREIAQADLDAELLDLERRSYKLYVLAETIRDATSFFRAVRAMLPLNPPVFSNDVWEALADSLWQGLYELDEAKIAIVWPRFQAMKATHQDDFEIALSVLVDTASSLAEPRPTVGRTKEVLVFLVRQ